MEEEREKKSLAQWDCQQQDTMNYERDTCRHNPYTILNVGILPRAATDLPPARTKDTQRDRETGRGKQGGSRTCRLLPRSGLTGNSTLDPPSDLLGL